MTHMVPMPLCVTSLGGIKGFLAKCRSVSTNKIADNTHTATAILISGCDHASLSPPKLAAPNPVVMQMAEKKPPNQSMLLRNSVKRPEPRVFFTGSRGVSPRVTAVRQIKARGA